MLSGHRNRRHLTADFKYVKYNDISKDDTLDNLSFSNQSTQNTNSFWVVEIAFNFINSIEKKKQKCHMIIIITAAVDVFTSRPIPII